MTCWLAPIMPSIGSCEPLVISAVGWFIGMGWFIGIGWFMPTAPIEPPKACTP